MTTKLLRYDLIPLLVQYLSAEIFDPPSELFSRLAVTFCNSCVVGIPISQELDRNSEGHCSLHVLPSTFSIGGNFCAKKDPTRFA
jgi:hypothetical protein